MISYEDWQRTFYELIRYSLVGLFSNLLAYSLFLVFTYWGMAPTLAMTLLYFLATVISFLGNWRWAFVNDQRATTAIVRSCVIYFLGYLINLCVMLYVEHLGYSYQLAQGIGILLVSPFLFIAFKLFVFPPHPSCDPNNAILLKRKVSPRTHVPSSRTQ